MNREEAQHILENEHQREREQELERLVTLVDGAQQRLDGRPDEAEQYAGGHQHQQEHRRRHAGADRPVHRGDAEVSPQSVERAAREVHDFLHAEHELQSGSHEKKNGGVKNAADEDVEKCRQRQELKV